MKKLAKSVNRTAKNRPREGCAPLKRAETGQTLAGDSARERKRATREHAGMCSYNIDV